MKLLFIVTGSNSAVVKFFLAVFSLIPFALSTLDSISFFVQFTAPWKQQVVIKAVGQMRRVLMLLFIHFEVHDLFLPILIYSFKDSPG